MTTNADILELRDFYGTPLGSAASRAISAALTPLWTPIPEERLVGLGYALPYLDRFAPDAERALALMPAPQGAIRWPDGPRPCRTALVGIDDLPIVDASIDRVLMVHALEFAENPEEMLAEIWRVLAPGGRLVVVVPNRRGVWSRFEHTPFGSGRPWSRGQLNSLLRAAAFTPSAFADALFFPPFKRRSALGFVRFCEFVGRSAWPVFSGVVVVEATKQVYRGVPVATKARRRKRVVRPVLAPAGAGARIRGF
ncbi:methyltransferase domain-containing protein [Aurantimonas sp. Leaf443]|uniref:class I SAM-dependent methyltransferase n=1 Tax=Aurantimonas sp. Leaf443 TaxID=1736378 RepID=UPI0007003A58|nr:methyltransferase domain-containing protein [Aurantimonas sp. Leaf443]KQT85853.1 SAM-dependent methyltransferase [Aurantimonas sp. Leaf443]